MSRFASFLVGMGGGYIKARDKEYDRERQAKDDAWLEEQRNRQRAEWFEKDAIKTSMKDAFADRSTIEGTAVTGTTGTNLYKDPGQAQAMADEARIEAEMRGESPSAVATTKATGITGNMSKGHQITPEPVDLKALNSRDAKWGRAVSAMMPFDPEKALSMENTVMEGRAKKLNLDVAQLKHLNSTYNQTVLSKLNDPSGDFFDNAAKIVTDAQFGGLVGATGRVERSADGKTVNIIVAKDGKDVRTIPVPNSAEGRKELVQKFMKADDATQLSFLKDDADREAAKAKAALEQRRVEVLEKNAATNERKLDGLLLRGMGGSGSVVRQGQQGGLNMADVDKQLAPMFTTEDPATGQKKLNTSAYAYVRGLATQMPAAMQGDSIGAALQAAQAYEVALTQAKGDHAKASQILAAAMQPTPAENPGATQTQVSPSKTSVPNHPPKAQSRGIFESPTGEIQLLQPLFNMNQWRKSLQQQTNDNSN